MIRQGDAGPENTVCSDMWQGMLDSDLDKWFELLRGCLEPLIVSCLISLDVLSSLSLVS